MKGRSIIFISCASRHVLNVSRTSSFVLCLVYESLSIFLYVHISKAFILPASVFDIVQASTPYESADHT